MKSIQFRKLLMDAVGETKLVIAVNLDVRGFSPFSKRDSIEVGLFIKKTYIKLVDDYFKDVSFVKPTGDGLLIVIEHGETDYAMIMARTVETCISVVRDFPSFFSDDEAVRFEVPKRIGIGLSSGPACRLVSGDGETIDYSGKTLNLASRLMDFARPSGVVFDSELGFHLLSSELSKLFVKDSVCVRGIAENTPIDIYRTRDTVIRVSDRKPKEGWRKQIKRLTAEDIRDTARRNMKHRFMLREVPINADKIVIRAIYPRGGPEGKRARSRFNYYLNEDRSYGLVGDTPSVAVRLGKLARDKGFRKLKGTEIVVIEIKYPVS